MKRCIFYFNTTSYEKQKFTTGQWFVTSVALSFSQFTSGTWNLVKVFFFFFGLRWRHSENRLGPSQKGYYSIVWFSGKEIRQKRSFQRSSSYLQDLVVVFTEENNSSNCCLRCITHLIWNWNECLNYSAYLPITKFCMQVTNSLKFCVRRSCGKFLGCKIVCMKKCSHQMWEHLGMAWEHIFWSHQISWEHMAWDSAPPEVMKRFSSLIIAKRF